MSTSPEERLSIAIRVREAVDALNVCLAEAAQAGIYVNADLQRYREMGTREEIAFLSVKVYDRIS